jgi:hypothetical protein
MKTTGSMSVSSNNASYEDVVTNNFSASQPTGELFATLKKVVREIAVNLPALIALKITNVASGNNFVTVLEPTDEANRDAIMADVIESVDAENVQKFVLQPEAETGLVKARGLWLATDHTGDGAYVEEDLRYIVRSFARPSVVRSYEEAVPAPSGSGTVTEETDERIYTVSQLISAIQRGCETDARFAGKQIGFIIDERAKALYVVTHGDSADRIDQVLYTERNSAPHLSFQITAPAAETSEPADFELV